VPGPEDRPVPLPPPGSLHPPGNLGGQPIHPPVSPEDQITAKWNALGGAPGAPASDVQSSFADGGCSFRLYANGAIFLWDRGAFWVQGAIWARYSAIGRSASALGRPTSDELPAGDAVGRVSQFEHGAIYWSPTTDAVELAGPHLNRWNSLGGINSYLGYPMHPLDPNNVVNFQRGTVNLREDQVFDVADLRYIDFGQINIDGAAANARARLTIISDGSWILDGDFRATGAAGFSMALAVVFADPLTDGTHLAFTASGKTSAIPLISGDRDVPFHVTGVDPRIQTNWIALFHARAQAILKVEMNALEVLGAIADILVIPVALVVAAFVGGVIAGGDPCGYMRQERIDPVTGQPVQTVGAVFVPHGQPCPPGTNSTPAISQ